MGAILSGQSGFQNALGQQVPQSQSSGVDGSGTSLMNPFMQALQPQQAGLNMGSTYDPMQYANNQNLNTGFNGGSGSYNFLDPSMPNFTANTANSGQQTLSTGQMQNPQGLSATGQAAPGSLAAQTQPQQASGMNPIMQQLLQMIQGNSAYQNVAPAQNPATPPAQTTQTQPQTPTVSPKQQPTVAANPWSAGTGANHGLENQSFNTYTGSTPLKPGQQGYGQYGYQEMYNPQTQQYSFSNPYLGDSGKSASTAAGAEANYNQQFTNDQIKFGNNMPNLTYP